MFNILLLSIYCFSLVISSFIDPNFNERDLNEKQYKIKNMNMTYTQRVSNHDQCMVELNNHDEKYNTLSEGEIIKINHKWFKVVDCQLHRAYLASCGSKLFRRMVDLVCSYVEQNYGKKILKKRQTEDDIIELIDRSYYGVCCKSACTITELVQFCHST